MLNTGDASHPLTRLAISHAPYRNGQRCDGGACPAVYRRDDGTIYVVGRKLAATEKHGLPMDDIEDAIEIPAELLDLLRRREA